MVVVGPMLATLMTVSNGGHLPLACDMDANGVTIQLGSRVQFFVELPKVSVPDACDACGGAGSVDLAEVLDRAVGDAESMQAMAWQDKLDADEAALAAGELAQADEFAEPAIDALEFADAGEKPDDSEQDITYQQLAAFDGVDFDADSQTQSADAPLAGVSSASADEQDAVPDAPLAGVTSASAQDDASEQDEPLATARSASAQDEASDDDAPVASVSPAPAEDQSAAEDDQPTASGADAAQEPLPSTDSAAADTDSATGPSTPNLLLSVRQTWTQRFAWVRNQVRNAFR